MWSVRFCGCAAVTHIRLRDCASPHATLSPLSGMSTLKAQLTPAVLGLALYLCVKGGDNHYGQAAAHRPAPRSRVGRTPLARWTRVGRLAALSLAAQPG